MGRNKSAEDRAALREKLWPESSDGIWPGLTERGWAKVPRVLPIILNLINTKRLRADKDIAATYLSFLCANYDEGFLEVKSESDFAESAGFEGQGRSLRMWRERVRILSELGLIKVQPRGKQEIGFILLVHPYKALDKLADDGRIERDGGWNLFQAKLREVGAFPDQASKASGRKPVLPLRVVGQK